MATTYELINKTILTSSQASIDFTSIPSTYTDLLVKISMRSTEASGTAQSTGFNMSINGSTADRSARILNAFAGTTVESYTSTSTAIGTIPGDAVTSNTFNNSEVYIPNYAGSNNKSFSVDSVTENNSSTNNNLRFTAGLWSQTTAISSLGFTSGAGDFASGTSIYLYGIKNS